MWHFPVQHTPKGQKHSSLNYKIDRWSIEIFCCLWREDKTMSKFRRNGEGKSTWSENRGDYSMYYNKIKKVFFVEKLLFYSKMFCAMHSYSGKRQPLWHRAGHRKLLQKSEKPTRFTSCIGKKLVYKVHIATTKTRTIAIMRMHLNNWC